MCTARITVIDYQVTDGKRWGVKNIKPFPKMSPTPGAFEAMANLPVIRGIHVPSLPGFEVGDAQGFSSNEED